MFLIEAKRIIVVILGSLLNALSLNLFLESANVYASGFTGTAQLISSVFTDFVGISVSTGILLFLLNIPVFILGWFKVGKGFTLSSIISVIFSSLFLQFLPIIQLSEDIILNAVFGGRVAGVGVGMTLKVGASTGGMDIVATYLSPLKDKRLAVSFISLKAVIIAFAGILYEPEIALYPMVALYVTARVIDAIHTRFNKLTAMIVTRKAKELQQAIHSTMVRGITILPAVGAYTNENKNM